MRWEDEPYIRFYKRNTPEWCLMSWQARGLFGLIMRELDRAGIIEVGKLGLKAVAVAIRAPWAEIEGPLGELLEDGCIVHREDLRIVCSPNFIEAQEAASSDKARQKLSRERARDLARAKSLGVTPESRTSPERSPPSQNDPLQPETVHERHSVLSVLSQPPVLSDPEPPRRAGDPDMQTVAEAIGREPKFAGIDPADMVRHTMHVGKRRPIAAYLHAVRQAVGDAVAGEQLHVTQKRLRQYLENARVPRQDPTESEPLASGVHRTVAPDDQPQTPQQAAEARRRMDKRAADQETERKRREEIDARFAQGGQP